MKMREYEAEWLGKRFEGNRVVVYACYMFNICLAGAVYGPDLCVEIWMIEFCRLQVRASCVLL